MLILSASTVPDGNVIVKASASENVTLVMDDIVNGVALDLNKLSDGFNMPPIDNRRVNKKVVWKGY